MDEEKGKAKKTKRERMQQLRATQTEEKQIKNELSSQEVTHVSRFILKGHMQRKKSLPIFNLNCSI